MDKCSPIMQYVPYSYSLPSINMFATNVYSHTSPPPWLLPLPGTLVIFIVHETPHIAIPLIIHPLPFVLYNKQPVICTRTWIHSKNFASQVCI
jgi:hypothetical protein